MKNANEFRLFRLGTAIGVIFLLICMPTISLGWGAGGHMMTAQIAFKRLNRTAKAKALELLAIPIDPAAVTRQSKDFVNASHWADDLRPFSEFDAFKPRHFIDKAFSLDGTPLPANDPDNIVKALEDNVEILKTSTDKNEQAQALRLIIHFVGDIHQPLHCGTRVDAAHPEGDRGGNLTKVKIKGANGKLKDTNLHSYWDGGIGNFPPSGPNFAPPPLSKIPAAVAAAVAGNPASDPNLKLNDPFNFDGWADESFALAKKVAYKNLQTKPTPAYNQAALKTARKRVAWGGYRLAALLNAIWPE
ncbi:MAG TPA: S1/P1 nuclease [Pyrinomonadaceae bacterium]|nr:S1/P1 nuclease [Pyrinomonadaceae bacterium]